MADVFKLIWRLDYDVSWAFLDNRGTAFRILTEEVEDYWTRQGFHREIRDSFFADSTSAAAHRNIVVEPTAISGAMEWYQGVELSKVLQIEEFRSLDRILKALLRHCQVGKLNRAGIRFIIAAGPKDDTSQRLAKNLALFSDKGRAFVTKHLGKINDVGIAWEGEFDPSLKYRFLFGPLEEKNVKNYLQNNIDKSAFLPLMENQYFADVDLYEKSISFSEHSFYRWSRTKLDKTQELLNDLVISLG